MGSFYGCGVSDCPLPTALTHDNLSMLHLLQRSARWRSGRICCARERPATANKAALYIREPATRHQDYLPPSIIYRADSCLPRQARYHALQLQLLHDNRDPLL